MKIILCENVAKLGKMGDTITVPDGYARNFLLPRKLAVRVDSASAQQVQHELRVIHKREDKQRTALQSMVAALGQITLEFKVLTGEEDKIFGSVTAAHVEQKLKELGHDVDRKHIVLEEPIKSLGIFSVPVRLAPGIEANIKIWVSKEEAEEQT